MRCRTSYERRAEDRADRGRTCPVEERGGQAVGETWPFELVGGIWSLVATRRYLDQRAGAGVESRSADSSAVSASARAVSSIPIESRRVEVS